MPDYAQKARALRAKAADPVVTESERNSLLAKARELEAKYGNRSSPFTNHTTVTSRDGRPSGGYQPSDQYWVDYMEGLVRNQWRWNSEYYDRGGNPVHEDEDSMYEEAYKYEEADYEKENDDAE